jgi:nucleoside-diphosphate-sugar epimerase
MIAERRLSCPFILLLRLYGRCTGPVRVLSVVVSSLALHTGHMAGDELTTTFVTEAAGFIGTELVKVLTARGHQVLGLTQSMEAAQRVRRAGAVAVMGDLLEPGQWQDEAAADWVFHLPPEAECRPRVTRRRAESMTRARLLMDAHLLEAVAAGATIHVHDCARALLHLAEHGEAGGRYFLVNSDPILLREFAETFARLANRPLRVWRMPAAARLVVGPVLPDHFQADAVFSNIRLRGIGFRFRYPTLEQGLQQVIGAFHE